MSKTFYFFFFGVIISLTIFFINLSIRRPQKIKNKEIDTVFMVDTVYKCNPVLNPIPTYTTFKVSDIVCVWGKWSGTVTKIRWSKNTKNLLIYDVTLLKGDEFEDSEFYDTEMKLGKCY